MIIDTIATTSIITAIVPNSGIAQLPTISKSFSVSYIYRELLACFPPARNLGFPHYLPKLKKVPSSNGLIIDSSCRAIVSTPSSVASMYMSRVLSSSAFPIETGRSGTTSYIICYLSYT